MYEDERNRLNSKTIEMLLYLRHKLKRWVETSQLLCFSEVQLFWGVKIQPKLSHRVPGLEVPWTPQSLFFKRPRSIDLIEVKVGNGLWLPHSLRIHMRTKQCTTNGVNGDPRRLLPGKIPDLLPVASNSHPSKFRTKKQHLAKTYWKTWTH